MSRRSTDLPSVELEYKLAAERNITVAELRRLFRGMSPLQIFEYAHLVKSSGIGDILKPCGRPNCFVQKPHK